MKRRPSTCLINAAVPSTYQLGKSVRTTRATATFSGGEAFAYELQALKRATVVGEVTGGGGHLVHTVRIDARFMLDVPFAQPINPITETNWEGTGVVPDVKASAVQALDIAEKLATAELAKRRSDQESGKSHIPR